MDELILKSAVEQDEITSEIGKKFDYQFDGEIQTEIKVPDFPDDFQIGLIVGSSGSGKSTLLERCFGKPEDVEWDNSKAIISHFASAEEGSNALGAAGLNSIPSWMKPYKVLSTGERFRADMARMLHNDATIDEFTSVVNRETAKSCCYSIQKFIRKKKLRRIVFASCHDDIVPWLNPDWVYDTDAGQFYNGRYLQREKLSITIHKCDGRQQWPIFKKHHYLSADLNTSASCYMAETNGRPIGFVACIAMPSGTTKHAWREHRLVVLPDFQGMGIGNALSEAVAQAYIEKGCRYFSKTANPRCGEHRDKSPLWKPTSKNHRDRKDYLIDHGIKRMITPDITSATRWCYSHEYIGDGTIYPYTYGQPEAKQMTIFDFI